MDSRSADGQFVEGLLYSAGSNNSRIAFLELGDTGATITDVDGTLIASAGREKLRISSRVGSISRRITLPDRMVFIADD